MNLSCLSLVRRYWKETASLRAATHFSVEFSFSVQKRGVGDPGCVSWKPW